jgi:glycine/D-amino acid oxidase-like deaminating enzyme
MTSKSLWADIPVAADAQPLAGDARCDVAVIGSGIAGLSTAYELADRGVSVMVIDRGKIASGMTSRTSAHLAPLCDDLMSEMKSSKASNSRNSFMRARLRRWIASRQSRRAMGLTAISGALTGFCFRAMECRLM